MQIRVKTQNVSPNEVAKALTGYILQEGLGDEVARSLNKSQHDHGEPIPEKYMRVIVRKMEREFRKLLVILDQNLDSWFALQARVPRKKFLRKAEDNHPHNLSDAQLDELRRLIEWHFKVSIGINVKLPKNIQKKWDKAGIETPNDNFEKWITQSYVSGRLQSVLDHGDNYSHMLELANKVPLTRVDQLMVNAAKKNAAKYIVGYGRKMADLAEDILTERHKSSIHDVVQHYFSGELTHTLYNEEGYTPEEAEKLLSTKKRVQGWRELSTELKNRFKSVDVGRDWDRIARSETRYAANLGSLTNIQHEGGGDPGAIRVYYFVHPNACKHCKELYLHEDGTPKVFTLQHILNNVQETGGMNVGKKASQIGESDGWIPNAIAHPNCQCVIMRFTGLEDWEPKKEDIA